jgi:hypothetical protein
MFWCEWRLRRWQILTACVFVFGIPLTMYALGSIFGFLEASISINGVMIMAIGISGPLAILLAVGATCADLKPGVNAFRQSRPITKGVWLRWRYASGVVSLCAFMCCAGAFEWFVPNSNPYEQSIASDLFKIFLIQFITVYSWSFFFACLCRNTVPAALLSLATGIIICTVPHYDAMNWINYDRLLKSQAHLNMTWPYIRFAIIYLLTIAVAVRLSWIAIQRDWIWNIGQ